MRNQHLINEQTLGINEAPTINRTDVVRTRSTKIPLIIQGHTSGFTTHFHKSRFPSNLSCLQVDVQSAEQHVGLVLAAYTAAQLQSATACRLGFSPWTQRQLQPEC